MDDYTALTNLISDPWIPVKRRDGTIEDIRPCDITSQYDTNPVVTLNVTRPDFNGALIQFLIGLLQTCCPPKSRNESETLFKKPPDPETLQEKFLIFKAAFNVQGDGPLFMQDFEDISEEGSKKSVSQLLIEQPGDQTLKDNKDLFIKRGHTNSLNFRDAQLALITLMMNAPSGGQGHRTSLRGGGPLTTLLYPKEKQDNFLWKVIWMNVIADNAADLADITLIFPWMTKTRTSEKNQLTTPEDTHQLTSFWATPRRIRFSAAQNGIKEYITKNYGANYPSECWQHSLTPYRQDSKDPTKLLPVLTPENGFTYEQWLGIALQDLKSKVIAANNRYFKKQRLWCFGYQMESAKVLGWIDSITPYFSFEDDSIQNYFTDTAKRLVAGAKNLSDSLGASISKCGQSGQKAKQIFWAKTEARFFRLLQQRYEDLHNDSNAEDNNLCKDWFYYLRDTVLRIFHDFIETGQFEYEAMEKQIRAKGELIKKIHSKPIKTLFKLN